MARLVRLLLRTVLVLAALVLVKALWFQIYRLDGARALESGDRSDLLDRRAYLVERVTDPAFGPRSFPEALGEQFRGEWAMVTMSMTGLALASMAHQFPRDRGTTGRDLDKLIDRATTTDLEAFDTDRWGAPARETLAGNDGHIGYLGHLALLLAADEMTFQGGANRVQIAALSAAIVRKITAAPCGLAETYPGEVYLPDNAVAIAALALAERSNLGGPVPALTLLQSMHARYGRDDLLPFRVGPDCQGDHVRGSGAAWSLLYLGLVDEAYARRGYESLKRTFFDTPAPGIAGFREWPRGDDRGGDVDSGPLPLGLS
ncbi:MAG: hypothetical protein EOO75_16040, partial [Myxococcales bacterium]